MIQQETKRIKLGDGENEDRLSDLPEFVILHIMSFFSIEYVVRTCVLSTRWRDLWKSLPGLIMRSNEFRSIKIFNKFVSKVLSLRDSSIALQSLDFKHTGCVKPCLLERIVNCINPHSIQRLELQVICDIEKIKHKIFSCHHLTFLNLWVYPALGKEKPLFPKFISFPALTTLSLGHFVFCASDNNAHAEPFSAFKRLNTLVLLHCGMRDTLTLCISSATLVNFRMDSYSYDFYEIEFCTPSLRTFAFTGQPYQKLSGSSLAYVKHVTIDARILSLQMEPTQFLFFFGYKEPTQFLLIWLLELAYTKSLTVTASTLQVLSFNADLLKMKLPFLGKLKFLKVKKEPLPYMYLKKLLEDKLQKIKSRKEAANLRKSFKAGLEPSAPIPDGIVEFLIQNSPSAEVEIVDC